MQWRINEFSRVGKVRNCVIVLKQCADLLIESLTTNIPPGLTIIEKSCTKIIRFSKHGVRTHLRVSTSLT